MLRILSAMRQTMLLGLFISHLHACAGLEISEGSMVEACVNEDFNARCGYDEVIVIVSAAFGHIHLGRCIERDLGFFGCSSDVSSLLSSKCTGKRTCVINVADVISFITLECSKGLSVFLEAKYHCVKGNPTSNTCDTLEVTSTEKYFLASTIFTEDCSTRGYVTMRVPEGQNVAVSLVDLSMNASSTAIQSIRVVDDGNEYTFERLRGPTTNPQWGFVSTSSQITLVFASETSTIIISYKATGCHDISIPNNAYTEKTGQDLTVKCYNTNQSWNLKCIGTRWLGSIGSCSVATQKSPAIIEAEDNSNHENNNSDRKFQNQSMQKEIIIGIIVAGTLVMCCLVFGLGFVCTKRMKRKYLPNKDYEKCEMLAVDGTIARMLKTDNVNTWGNTMIPSMSRIDHVAMDRDFITVNTNNL